MDTLENNEIQNFCSLKDTIMRFKDASQQGEDTFTHMNDKGTVFRIDKGQIT